MNNERNWGEMSNDISIPRVREARDMVYNGTMPSPDPTQQSSPLPGVTRNRRTTRRKYSPFNIILSLLLIAVVSVLYISNILAVGRLSRQINDLEQIHQRMQNEQELLRAQINRLSSLERIGKDAGAALGLGTPTTTPVWLEVDRERIAELEATLKERSQR
jgi:cell division protein FtsB